MAYQEDSQITELPTNPNVDDEMSDVIRIHISVVASIVKFSALEISGVHSVGGSGLDGLLEHLGGRKAEKGVQVTENDQGDYDIKVNLEMNFGTPLAETAKLVTRNIREKVKRMTSKNVHSVEISIDGVRNDKGDATAEPLQESWERNPN